MLVVGLVSGGKDSCYNMIQCVAAGHKIIALANLRPADSQIQEADSQMFQTVGWDNIHLLGEAMDLPVFVEETLSQGKEIGRDYLPTLDDEVEDMYRLLERVKQETGVKGVSVGAILSDYQRVRVESVCLRLGLTPLAYLWQRDQTELLREMIDVGMVSVLVKVACLGLSQEHLGKSLEEMEPRLSILSDKYGVNMCGEGGEYETFTLDCPLFRCPLVVIDNKIVIHSNDAFAPVCLLVQNLVVGAVRPDRENVQQSDLLSSSLKRKIQPEMYITPYNDLVDNDHDGEIGEPDLVSLDLVNSSPEWRDGKVGCFEIINIPGMGEGDPTESVRKAFTHLITLLADHSASLDMVVKVVMYVDSMENYQVINSEYVTHFGLNPPVRVCVALGSNKLPRGSHLVLSVVGHKELTDKRVMHVQGVSHWAPANIGPYSQGVMGAGDLYVSGQIGLIPGTMELVRGVSSQSGLALRHVSRVFGVMLGATGYNWDKVSSVTCYVLNIQGANLARQIWYQEAGKDGVDIKFILVKELPRQASVEWEIVYKYQCREDC